MHFLFRFFLILLKKRGLPKATFAETTSYSMRVLPTDLDILMHVNNGVYFSYMDFGRWDMTFRTGLYDVCQKKGWYPVVASETIKFRKSLQLWDKFTIETKNFGYDDKYFYLRQEFKKNGVSHAVGYVKARFLKKSGGKVDPLELMDAVGLRIENRAENLSRDWAEFDSAYFQNE